MMAAWEYWVGNRYVRSKSGNRFVSLISAISMLGIAIAVMVLIVVLSVVNGFERELKDRLLAMTAHASIEGAEGQLADWQTVAATAAANPRVLGSAPYIDGQALLVAGAALSGAELRGVDPARESDGLRISAAPWCPASSAACLPARSESCWASSWQMRWTCMSATS